MLFFMVTKSQANRTKLSLTISVRISAFVRCGLNVVGTGADDTDGLDAFAAVLPLPTVGARAIGIFSL